MLSSLTLVSLQTFAYYLEVDSQDSKIISKNKQGNRVPGHTTVDEHSVQMGGGGGGTYYTLHLSLKEVPSIWTLRKRASLVLKVPVLIPVGDSLL
jgi:hypothetical protein